MPSSESGRHRLPQSKAPLVALGIAALGLLVGTIFAIATGSFSSNSPSTSSSYPSIVVTSPSAVPESEEYEFTYQHDEDEDNVK